MASQVVAEVASQVVAEVASQVVSEVASQVVAEVASVLKRLADKCLVSKIFLDHPENQLDSPLAPAHTQLILDHQAKVLLHQLDQPYIPEACPPDL